MIIILPVNAHSHFQGPSNVIFDDGNHDDEKREKRIDVHCWWSCAAAAVKNMNIDKIFLTFNYFPLI